MDTRIEDTILKVKEGELTIGSWIQMASSDVAEIMGKSGYDWIALDMEHGSFSYQAAADIIRVIELCGTVPVVRVAQVSQKDIKQALDAGAKGLIYPMIDSADLLQQAIEWSLYPPEGNRGVGYCRANLFGKEFESYVRNESVKIFKVAQIEHINAVKNLGSILSVKGLDAIIVGPYDLSGSMNLAAKFEHPEFIKTLSNIKEKANEYRIPMGLHIVEPNIQILEEKIKEGYLFIAYGIDAVFLHSNSLNPLRRKVVGGKR